MGCQPVVLVAADDEDKMDIDLEQYSPFRGPRWRYERAMQLMAADSRGSRRDDPGTLHLVRYLRAYDGAEPHQREDLAYEDPGLSWALSIFEKGPARGGTDGTSSIMEALLLAGCGDKTSIGTVPASAVVITQVLPAGREVECDDYWKSWMEKP